MVEGTRGTQALVRDPVCGMMVDPQQAPWREPHEGTMYFFCNPRCAGKFRAHPARYVEALALIWERQSPAAAPAPERSERVRRRYRRNVRWYDLGVERTTARLRAEAVARLALTQGARVLDLGCGTGLSFPLLRAAVGASGAVYGVDLSPDMLEAARRRSREAGWTNVHGIEADAESFELPEPVDGLLCFYANDILLSPTALPRALGFLRPGARVVAAGAKLARGWRGALVNPLTRAYSGLAVTRALVHEPYAVLRERLSSFRVDESGLGSQYLAAGVHQP
jgi:demethylmenaquinone methyltransferase/2-methoxy-6-polyprenyl-1,4-benzoquinol methylase